MCFIAGGIVLIAIGALLSIVPWIPGSLLMGVGALVLCAESQTAARAVDFVEAWGLYLMRRLRRAARRLQR